MERLNISTQIGFKETVTADISIQPLGESYQQLTFGASPKHTFELTSGFLSLIDRNYFDQKLTQYNGKTEFYYQPCENLPLFSVRCPNWSFTQISPNTHLLKATFTKSKTIDCQEIATNIDISDIDSQLQKAFDFIKRFTRDSAPNFANSLKLPLNAFHVETGRRNYFPDVCGTTEGIYTIALALLDYYKLINNQELLNYVLDMIQNAINVVYRGQQIPTNVNQRWLPHWLYTARGTAKVKGATAAPNFLQSGYFDVNITFTNGVGTLPNNLADVYKIYDGALLWKFVFSPVISGNVYQINYWINQDNKKCLPSGDTFTNDTSYTPGKVVLNTNFSGTVKAVYSLFTGDLIANNSCIEAFPMWRNCLTGSDLEINHAMDVSNWALPVYLKLFEITQDTKWQRAAQATINSTITASQVKNESYIFKKDAFTTEPFSYAGTQLIKVNGKEGSVSKVTSGNFVGSLLVNHQASAPATYGQLELQNFAVQAIWTRATSMTVEIKASVDTLFYFGASLSDNAFDFTKLYYAVYKVAANTARTLTFKALNFLQWTNKTFWYSSNADLPIYTYQGNGGTASASQIMAAYNGTEILVSRLSLNKGNGYAGGGFGVIENRPRLSNLLYKLTGHCEIWITDGAGNKFIQTLPVQDWQEYLLRWDDFTPEIIGKTPDYNNPVTSIEFKTNNTCELQIYYLGLPPKQLPASSYVYKHTIVNKTASACTWIIGDVKVNDSPLNELPYSPAVFPFTANYVGTSRVSWTGSPYTGYCAEMFHVLAGYPNYAKDVVSFKKAAQESYADDSPSGASWVMRQVYNWARWDAIARPPYNRFVDEGPDPNIAWEGYAHRAIEATSEYWRYNPNDYDAQIVVMRFLTGLYQSLKQRESQGLSVQSPSDYPPPNISLPLWLYTTPHGDALCLRTAVNANLAGGDRLITIWLIDRLWKSLQSQFVNTGLMSGSWSGKQDNYFSSTDNQMLKKYFPFWHGEIISACLLLKNYKTELRYPTCDVWKA